MLPVQIPTIVLFLSNYASWKSTCSTSTVICRSWRFKPREIEAAKSGFSTALETGGPRGTAYSACFADGLVATVRRAAGDRGHEEHAGAFYRELQLLRCLNHRHMVRLYGFSERHNRFLVFDEMENRSLKECLHDPLRTPLNWWTRLQVAIGVAAALVI